MLRRAILIPPSLPKAKQRKVRTRLILAAAFVALGIGNIFYGQQRYTEYEAILSKANAELTSPEKKLRVSILTPTVNVDKHSQYIEKLRSRIDFYHLVVIGGACFLVLAALFLLLAYLNAREGPPPSDGA